MAGKNLSVESIPTDFSGALGGEHPAGCLNRWRRPI
jgi:hypothetical protein